MIQAAQDPPTVVIAPDYQKSGTNGLLINPAGLIQYEFGPGSFERHIEQAKAKGAKVEVLELPSLAHDVDLPEDLTFLNGQLNAWTHEDGNGKEETQGYYSRMSAQGE